MDVAEYVKNLPSVDDKQIKSSRSIPSTAIPDQVKTALDAIFAELMDCKPSWRNAFKSKEEAVNYKKALGVAMAGAKIDTYEKAKFGIAYAQLDESPFFPSVGQFVSWCKAGYNDYLYRKKLLDNTSRILGESRMIENGTKEERDKIAKDNIEQIKKLLKK